MFAELINEGMLLKLLELTKIVTRKHTGRIISLIDNERNVP